MNDASQGLAFTLGAFIGTLLLAFLVSRLGLYIRRSSRFEPATVASVHAVSFLILSIAACGSRAGTPGSSVLAVFVAQAIICLIDMLRLPRPEDYSDDIPQTLRPLAGIRAAAVLGALLLGFGLVYVLARPATDQDLIAELERGMNEVPGAGLYFDALKRNFPEEYHALMTETAQRLRAARRSGDGPAAETRLGEEAGRQILAMVASKAPAMAKAPTPALNAYARSMKDYVLTVQKTSPMTCAALVGGLAERDAQVAVSRETHEASATMLAARLHLARAGLDHPTERPAAAPTAALRQVADEVRRRDPSVARHLGDLDMAAYLPTRTRCAIAVHYYSAIAEMPAETSAILTAYDLGAAVNPDSASATAPLPQR